MSDDAEDKDVDRLRAVAAVVRELGMRVTALRVGDIQVHLEQPWGAAPPPMVAAPARAPEDPEARLSKLRDYAKRSLGYVPSDEQLEKFAPAFPVSSR